MFTVFWDMMVGYVFWQNITYDSEEHDMASFRAHFNPKEGGTVPLKHSKLLPDYTASDV